MYRYTHIAIIYNPNSTGPSEELAYETAAKLHAALPNQRVEVIATQFAKHGEELAYDLAKQSAKPLIISASGDGGYHEVVNGIMRANNEGTTAVASLLPAGNANDHYHAMHIGDFIDSVVHGIEQPIDLLTLTADYKDGPVTRYAHSYIGLGLTPKVGRELTKTRLNRVKEVWIVVKSLLTFRHTTVRIGNDPYRYHSLVFTNIGRMAKILNLAQESNANDGKFELSVMKRQTRLHLLASLLKASTLGLYSTRQTDAFSFRTIRRTLVQMDGEVLTIDRDTKVTIGIEQNILRCIV